MPGIKVEVIRMFVYRGPSTSNRLAEASIKLYDKIEIHKCSVLQGNDGLWVAAPQYKYTDKEGKDKWGRYVSWPKEWDEPIKEAVIAAYKEKSANGQLAQMAQEAA